ncbi:hypothetical protein [Bradyrhizobium sp. CCBAU 11361]|uniref:hypothetical protein n=1 Tax=Bradyrhizobium sp. CCBAU 11361 TaxID=1630812 RepID=UPI0023026AD1|nr:hypothetical protein [Bradyrhizobium sp. CCBAU 11361]
MSLFRHLHDDAFLAFSRDHKHLYAACLLDLHERFFSGAPAFPSPQQVMHAIYDVMRANPTLWSETDDFGSLPEMISAGRRRIRRADVALASEKGEKALGLARQLYARLLAWGARGGGIWPARHSGHGDGTSPRHPAVGEPQQGSVAALRGADRPDTP